MIDIVVLKNKEGKVVFSVENVNEELVIPVYLNAEDVTEKDKRQLKEISYEFEVERNGNIICEIATIELIGFEFEKLTISEEEYDFNEEGVLVKVE